MPIVMFIDNLPIQIAPEPKAGSRALETVTAHAGTLQRLPSGVGGQLQGNWQASQPFRSGQITRQGTASRNSRRVGGYHAQTATPILCQLLPSGEARHRQGGIPSFQIGEPLALTPVSGQSQWNPRFLLLRAARYGWTDSIQSSPRHCGDTEVLPCPAQIEWLVSASGLRIQADAIAEKRQGYWVGFRHQESCRGQQRKFREKPEASRQEFATISFRSTTYCAPQERQQQTQESLSVGGANPRTHQQSETRLFAQGRPPLRQRLRHNLHRRFTTRQDAPRRAFGAIHFRRQLVYAQATTPSQSRKRWTQSNRRAATMDEPKVFKVRRPSPKVAECPNPLLSALRIHRRPRHQCGGKYFCRWDTAVSERSLL